jgi:hypothetical protein
LEQLIATYNPNSSNLYPLTYPSLRPYIKTSCAKVYVPSESSKIIVLESMITRIKRRVRGEIGRTSNRERRETLKKKEGNRKRRMAGKCEKREEKKKINKVR